MFSWHNFKKCASFFLIHFLALEILNLKKKQLLSTCKQKPRFSYFSEISRTTKFWNGRPVFFSKKCLLELAIVKTFIFFFKKSWFLYTSEYFRKICFVDENKNYSVPQTLLRDIVAKTAFKKRRTFNVSTVGNFSVQC